MVKKKENSEIESYKKPEKINPWMLATIALAVVIVFMLVRTNLIGNVMGGISKELAGTRVTNLINNYFIQDGSATLSSVSEESGLYKVNLNYKGNVLAVYATKDGKFLILPNGIVSIEELEAT